MWKRAIEGKKRWVAFLETEKSKLEASDQTTLDPRDIARDPPVRKQWEERGIQKQFASEIPAEKKQLEEMQETARKAGMPRDVYDPQ